ncbi:MAG: hypothetical protein K5945_07545 [Bacteroidaceae bacterium]|nr:hypothetical protein [Bacteroidaceae bacterium]
MNAFEEYFKNIRERNGAIGYIHSCPELMDCIRQIGFLPLLESGIPGYAAESLMAEECRYTKFDDGSWEWPLWQWKGEVVREMPSVYGKFFAGKAGFISREWWPDFYNWRRSQNPVPEEGSIEDVILSTLRIHGSMITRELRAACDFTGKNMRSRFDAYVGRMQMACYIVTEDFVYPVDKHGREYGFGWSLLTTPERFLGREACLCDRTPEESFRRMVAHLSRLLPDASEAQIARLII